MALKDLVAAKGSLDEEVIERIIEPYVRYDVDTRAIHATPAFNGLSNKGKILVYLVALQGWRFVIDEAMPGEARPAEIEAATDIPGGSLRPTLSLLRDSRMIFERDSFYSVRGTSLPAIEAELGGAGAARARPTKKPSRKAKPHAASVENIDDGADEPEAELDADDADDAADAADAADAGDAGAEAKTGRKPGGKTKNLAGVFDNWIEAKWFDEPRTLSDVHQRFRKKGVIVPQTSLSGLLLRAVQKGRLERDEMERDGKVVWTYSTDTGAS